MHNDAKKKIHRALGPCFQDPPQAAAVIIINSAEGTAFYNINMDTLEMHHAVMSLGVHLERKLNAHTTPELTQ